MGTPTRYPSGVTNVTKADPLGQFTMPDPSSAHVYFNDFDSFVSGDWTATTSGSTSTAAIVDGDGGLLALTTDVGAADYVYLDKKGESFLLEAGKKSWFKTRFKCSEASTVALVVGLQITDTSPMAVTDGVYFYKASGAAALTLQVVKNSTATSSSVATLVADTFIDLAFYYNGVDGISYFVDGVQLGTSAVTNLPDDEVLTVSIGILNAAAAAESLTVDYVLAAKAR